MKEAKNIEEYLSFVRHELRNQLTIVHEGTAQISEGFGKGDCNKCAAILKPTLESADKLNELIEELLNASKFKSLSKDQRALEKAKFELLTMIAHTVRTPLTIIKEGVSLVLDEIPGKLNSKQKEFLTDSKNNVDRLIQSVEQLLSTPWEDKMDKKMILLVDDEEDFRKLIGTRIRSWGYDLIEASNAKEAIDAIMSKNPDIVILDYMMPNVNGVEVLRQIRMINKKIPVIMFTAYPDEESIKGTEKLKVSFYIPKLSPCIPKLNIYQKAQTSLRSAISMIEKKLNKNKKE